MNTFYTMPYNKKYNRYELGYRHFDDEGVFWHDKEKQFDSKQSALAHIKSLHPAKSPLKWELVKVLKTGLALFAYCGEWYGDIELRGISFHSGTSTYLNNANIIISHSNKRAEDMESFDDFSSEINRDAYYDNLHAALTELENQLKTEPKIQIFEQGESCLVVVEE